MIPRPGERGAPLLADDGLQPPQRGQRERAERVAVQVDQGRVVKREPLAEPGQRIRRVQFLGVRPLQEHLGHTAHHNSQATALVPRGRRSNSPVPRRWPSPSAPRCGSLPSARGSAVRAAAAALRPGSGRSPPAIRGGRSRRSDGSHDLRQRVLDLSLPLSGPQLDGERLDLLPRSSIWLPPGPCCSFSIFFPSLCWPFGPYPKTGTGDRATLVSLRNQLYAERETTRLLLSSLATPLAALLACLTSLLATATVRD